MMDGLSSFSPIARLNEELAKALNLDNNEVLNTVFKSDLSKSDSTIRPMLIDSMMYDVRSVVDLKKKRKKLVIDLRLDHVEKQILVDTYPEYTLEFSDSSHNSHALAHASRIIEHRLLMDTAQKHSSTTSHDFGIIDIGGNYYTHFKNRDLVHSCCPMLDTEDDLRNTDRRTKLTSIYNLKEYEKFRSSFNGKKFYCNKPGQECEYTASVCIFLHSMYNMTNTNIADILDKKKAFVGLGTMMFTPEILIKKTGVIKGLNVSFEKFKNGLSEYIQFFFNGDYSKAYTHKLSTYLETFNTSMIKSSSGNMYHVEYSYRANGIMYIRFIKSCMQSPRSLVVYNIWENLFSDSVVMTTYDWDITYCSDNPVLHMKEKKIIVDAGLYDICYNYILTKPKEQFTIETLLSATVSFNTRFMVNGQVVTGLTKLKAEDLLAFATGLYLMVYQQKWEQGKVMETITKELDKIRKNATATFWTGMRDIITGKTIINAIRGTEMYSAFVKFFAWKNYRNRFPITVDMTPKKETIREYLSTRRTNSLPTYDAFEDNEYDVQLMEEVNDAIDKHVTPIDEYLPKPVVCNEHLEPVSVRGDGNCMFYACMHLLNIDMSVKDFKNELMKKPVMSPQPTRDEVRDILSTDGKWGNTDVLLHIAICYNVTFCVHDHSGMLNSVNCLRIGEHGEVYHLKYDHSHYEPLIHVTSIKPRFIRPSGFSKSKYIEQKKSKYSSDKEYLLYDYGVLGFRSIIAPELSEVIRSRNILFSKVMCLGAKSGVSLATMRSLNSEALIYADNTYTKEDVTSVRGDIVPTLPDKKIQMDLRVELMDIVPLVISETCIKLTKEMLVNVDKDTIFIIRLKMDELEAEFAYYSHYFRKLDLQRANVSGLTSDVVYLIGYGVRLYEHDEQPELSLLNGAYEVLYKDLLKASLIATTTTFTNRLTVDEWNKFSVKYLTRNKLIGGGGVLSRGRPIIDFGDDKIYEHSLEERLLKNGLYDRGVSDVFEDSAIGSLGLSDSSGSSGYATPPSSQSSDHQIVDSKVIPKVKEDQASVLTFMEKAAKSLRDRSARGDPIVFGDGGVSDPELELEITDEDVVAEPPQSESYGENVSVIVKNIASGIKKAVKSLRDNPAGNDIRDDSVKSLMLSDGETTDSEMEMDIDEDVVVAQHQSENYMDIKEIVMPMRDNVSVLVRNIANGDGAFKPIDVNPKAKYKEHLRSMHELIEDFRVSKYVVFETHTQVLTEITENNWKYRMKKYKKFDLIKDNKIIVNNTGINDFMYKFVLIRDSKNYNRVIGGEFIPFKKEHRGFALTSQSLELFLEPQLYDKTEDLIGQELHDFKYNFIQGVPGCGKSRYIIDNHKPNRDLVLFPTRSSKIDFMRRVKEKYKIEPNKDNYRTLYSYLMNSTEKFENVWIDEAMMYHAGAIIMVIVRTRCKKITMLGDRLQIPFIHRGITPMFRMDVRNLFETSQFLNKSYRCPEDAIKCFEPDYIKKAGMKSVESASKHKGRSLYFKVIRNTSEIERNYDVFLTFKQSEKQTLLALGYNASTIHEYQGQQAERVAVVRLSTKPREEIYLSQPHILVAMTRHTKSFMYFTMLNQKDGILSRILSAYKLSGGAVYGTDDITTYGKYVKLDERKVGNDDYIREKLRGIEKPVVSYVAISKHYEPSDFMKKFSKYDVGIVSNGFTPDQKVVIDEYSNMMGLFKTPVVSQPKNVEIQKPKLTSKPVKVKTDVQYLQMAHDMVFDGSLVNQNYDYFFSEYRDMSLHPDNMKFSLVKKPVKMSDFSCLRPRLRTIMPPPRNFSQMETMMAIIKRNHAGCALAADMCVDEVSDVTVENFIDSYLTTKTEFSEIGWNHTLVRNWLKTQKGTAMPKLDDVDMLIRTKLDEYNVTIKKTPKPKLEGDAIAEYLALQTICYQGPMLNLLFCSIFKELRLRLMSVLKNKFVIFNDMSLEDFESRLDGLYDLLIGSYGLEIDISKYDKSQDELCLLIETKIYKFLGLSDELINMWRVMHEVTRLYDRSTKVSTEVIFQRKSGDACTFFGNTIVLMAILAMLYDMFECRFGMFAGDDSLLFMDTPPLDKTALCGFVFNLESKIFKYQNYYFCSKFVIFTERGTYFVPDPVKMLVKLGTHGVKNFKHLKEYVISLRDLVKQYNRVELAIPLSIAVSERYPNAPSMLHEHLYSIITSDQIFEMFFQEEGTVLYPDSCEYGKLD